MTQEKVDRFLRDNRAAIDLCRIVQTDFIGSSEDIFAHAYKETEARAMVRCFGSFIDGLTYAMRRIATSTGRLFGRPLNHFLEAKVEERTIDHYNRIYTSYRLIGEFLPGSPMAKVSDTLWDDLHAAIEIRNRIVHPKCVKDLEVKGEDAMMIIATGNEFCRHANQFVQWLLQKEQKLIQPYLVEARRLCPKIGRNATCPCRSGRKYKDCCIRAALAA